jgi:hypothetical protein
MMNISKDYLFVKVVKYKELIKHSQILLTLQACFLSVEIA